MMLPLMYRKPGRVFQALSLILLALLFGVLPHAAVMATATSSAEQQAFADAAAEFKVPESLLLALAYNESRGESNGTQMSMDGGFGVMDLRTYVPATISGRDGTKVQLPKKDDSYYMLERAARLLHEPAQILQRNDRQNIRGAAAVLAASATELNGGRLPATVGDWYGAVAQYSGATDVQAASLFADDVFATLAQGLSLTTTTGQHLSSAAIPDIHPDKAALPGALPYLSDTTPDAGRSPGQSPECPSALQCRFVPAAYAVNTPGNPADYGNFDYAHRPADMQIKYIFIHDTEGSYDSAIAHFQDPKSYTSAHYVIRSSDGMVTQMVPNEDVAWGVGNWYMNMHGINIEHEGFAVKGGMWYTPAMYRSSAELVRWLAHRYHIPLDRQHIIAHGEAPRNPAANQAKQHWDPGPYWDWDYYMKLIQGRSNAAGLSVNNHLPSPRLGQVVTISPDFASNREPIEVCDTSSCTPAPQQGSNIVYLHTKPDANAPLLNDPYLHPTGSPGTTHIDDWSATVAAGFKYVVAATQGDWLGIWYAGQIGWLYNTPGTNRVAEPSISQVVMPRPGLKSITVYSTAFPESSAYPTTIPVQAHDPMYTMFAGQRYTTTGEALPTDYFYDATADYSKPDDHMLVRGHQRYYQIVYNHHVGFVNADDVTVRYDW